MYREDEDWGRAFLPGFMGITSTVDFSPSLGRVTMPAISPTGQSTIGPYWQRQVQDAFMFDRNKITPAQQAALNQFYAANRSSSQVQDHGDLKGETLKYLQSLGYGGPNNFAAGPGQEIDFGIRFDENFNLIQRTPEEEAAQQAKFNEQLAANIKLAEGGSSLSTLQDFLNSQGLTLENGVHQTPGASQWTQLQRIIDKDGNVVAVDAHNNRREAGDRIGEAAMLAAMAAFSAAAPAVVGAAPGTVAGGAASGVMPGVMGAAYQGGDMEDLFMGGLKGAATGAVAGGAVDLAGDAWGGLINTLPEGAADVLLDLEEAIRGAPGKIGDLVSNTVGNAGQLISDSGILSPVTISGPAAGAAGAAGGALTSALTGGLAASQVGALAGGSTGTTGIDQLERVEVTGPAGGQPDPWSDALVGAMPGLVSTPDTPTVPIDVPQLPKVEVTGPGTPATDPWEALLDAIGGIAGGAPAQPPVAPTPAPVVPDVTLPTETITGPGAPPEGAWDSSLIGAGIGAAVTAPPPAQAPDLTLPKETITAPSEPPPPSVIDSLIPGLGGALAGTPDLTLPKETIVGPRGPDDDPRMTIMPVFPQTPPVDATFDKVTVTGPAKKPEPEPDFTIPGVIDRIDTPKIPGQLPNDIPPTDADAPPVVKPPAAGGADWSKIIGNIIKGGGLIGGGLGGALKPILDGYNFRKADAEADRSWADYQSWANRTTGAMDKLDGLMGSFQGELKGYQDGKHNTFDKVGTFTAPKLNYTRTEDPKMTDFGELRKSLAGSINPGSSGTGALNAEWNRQRARSEAAQGDVAAMREGVKKGVEALDPLKIYGEADVRRLSDQSYNNKVGAVDRSLQASASEGFARALSRGVSNSTIAADTRDNVVRRFADTYGQLRDGSDRTAMSEVRGLSDMQNSQRGQQISEIEKRFDVKSALQGLSLADQAAAAAMSAYGNSASADANRALQASTAEAQLARDLKSSMDSNLWRAADRQDARDEKLFESNYRGAKESYDSNWKTADTLFRAGNDRLNNLTSALNNGYGRIADTSKDITNTAGRNYQANMAAKGQALNALVTTLGGGTNSRDGGVIGNLGSLIGNLGDAWGNKGGSGEFDWDWDSFFDWFKKKP